MKSSASRTAACLIIIALSALACGAQSSEAQRFPEALSGLCSALVSSDAASRPVRIAFLPLAASGSGNAAGKDFGLFFAERLASSVKSSSSKIRIFERSRLADILAEAELDASGAVDAKGAMRIGELAPVDALFTGSYVRVGGTVAVSARLVSAVSGELLFARSLSIAVDDSISGFFSADEGARAAAAPQSDEDKLKAALARMRDLLADLSSESKLETAVRGAEAYPLFGLFAPVHELAASTFLRFKKPSGEYRGFLVKSLNSASLINGDEDLYALRDALDYLSMDRALDDAEFSAGLAGCRATSRSYYYYGTIFKFLLVRGGRKGPLAADERAKLLPRIDAIMSDVKAGRIGKPVGIDSGRGLLGLLEALKDDSQVFLAAYDKYARELPKEGLAALGGTLQRKYEAEPDKAAKLEIVKRIADNFNAAGYAKASDGDSLYDFFVSLDADEGGEAYARILVERCGPGLSAAIAAIAYNKQERILLCLKYGIDCPSIVPSFDRIKRSLQLGEDIEERRGAAAMLLAMGARAAPAEDAVDKVLGYIADGSIEGMGTPNLQMECIAVLASIGARSPKSLALVAMGLRHDYSDVRDAAAEACLKIGSPAAPYVLEAARSGRKEQRLDALKLLGRMGPAASSARGGLEAILGTEKDAYIRDMIGDTIARIGG